MRRFVLANSSKTSACATGWKTRVCVNMTSTNTVPYWQQNFPLPTNSTQWLDSLRPNELGVRLLGFLTTVKRKLRGKRDFHDSKRIAAQLNIKLADGSFHPIEKRLLFETGRTSELLN